jgi:hypothetical protein
MAKKAKVSKKVQKSNSTHWAGKQGTIGYLARTLIAKNGDRKDLEFYIKELKKEFPKSKVASADLSIYRRQVKQAKKFPK